uniref:Uncharacterized protein n=1 Tax=Tanacetum cinerariifolium TaxID=118510 RepID=A0A6L2N6A5_TANCI|nr:hypothetical protein [Tanacetum cinerariifolium]
MDRTKMLGILAKPKLRSTRRWINKSKDDSRLTKIYYNARKCERTDHRTCNHAEYMSLRKMVQYLKTQGGSFSRSKPLMYLDVQFTFLILKTISESLMKKIMMVTLLVPHLYLKPSGSSTQEDNKLKKLSTFDESTGAIKFSKTLVDDITIAELERYQPDEYLHHFKPSQRYQVDSNVVQFIELYDRPEPIVTEVVALMRWVATRKFYNLRGRVPNRCSVV